MSYVIDARGRRVGKKVSGALTREWLYDGQLTLVGEIVPGGVRAYGYLPGRRLPMVMVEPCSTTPGGS